MDNNNDNDIEHSLGWEELRETVLMLNLAVAQIEMSMKDGDHSVSTLIDSFTTMSGCMQVIDSASSEIPDEMNEDTDCRSIRETIQANGDLVTEKTAAAIVAFQFYDKLTQRLSHVSTSLTDLTKLVADPKQIDAHDRWNELRERIRKTYSMVDEASMYEAIMQGKSIEEAVSRATDNRDRAADESNNSGEVDLF